MNLPTATVRPGRVSRPGRMAYNTLRINGGSNHD